MFIQVIQGKVRDADRLRECMDRWQRDLQPGATGYVGTTAGTADDGTFIALAQFESAEAAQANSDRPEQGAWWADTATCFAGEVTFVDCANVQTMLNGSSPDAHFVQIMEGRSDDVARMHELFNAHSDELHEVRPEILGGLMLDAGEGRYVDAIYFTTEEAARRGESLEPPEEVRADLEEGMRLMGEVTYHDIREPMLVSSG